MTAVLGTNIVQNGDFTDSAPNPTGLTTTPVDWTFTPAVSGSFSTLVVSSVSNPTGCYPSLSCYEIGGAGNTPDLLSQTLSTIAGATYDLSFWYSADGAAPALITAGVNGATVINLVNPATSANPATHNFEEIEASFVAPTSSTVLSIGGYDNNSFAGFTSIAVQEEVIPSVPEPSSMALSAAGLVLLCVARKLTHRTDRTPSHPAALRKAASATLAA